MGGAFDPHSNKSSTIVNMCSFKVWVGIGELSFHEKTIFLESSARLQVAKPHSWSNAHQTAYPNLAWQEIFSVNLHLLLLVLKRLQM